MKQTARIISIYAADTSGVCSALYELGGMTVVHDASGCNSTYTTHDEPRWWRQDSMVYISALTQTDAILGNDQKFIDDLTTAARQLSPRFIALCGAPIPMMIGTDFEAIAETVEKRTGIPTFGLHTSGMHSYLTGASEALLALCRRFCRKGLPRTPALSANLLGLTPLDFSINGVAESMTSWLGEQGFQVIAPLAMNCTLEQLAEAGAARVNLVASFSGLAAAQWLQQEFGTPYVVGVPIGCRTATRLAQALRDAAAGGTSQLRSGERSAAPEGPAVCVVGESVFAASLADALSADLGMPARVLCQLETQPGILAPGDLLLPDEADVEAAFRQASSVIADPLYAPVCPTGIPFHALPHEAFSGRCYHRQRKNLIARSPEILFHDQEPSC